MRKQVTFVGGEPRSGTTLALNLFRGHPDVYGPDHESLALGIHQPHLARLARVGRVRSRDDFRRIFAAGFQHTGMSRFGLAVDDVMALERRLGLDLHWRSVPLILLEALREKFGKAHLVVKVPRSEPEFLWLDAALRPVGWEPRFLSVMRHPFDAYASFRARSTARWRRVLRHTDVLGAAEKWRCTAGYALDLPTALRDRYRAIRFEDLTADPATHCRALCAWIGARPAVREMLGLAGAPVCSSFEDQGTTAAGRVRNLSNRKRAELSPEESAAIRAVCGLRALSFGYDLEADPRDEPPAYLDQLAAAATIRDRDYPGFLSREVLRRAARTAKVGYSVLTGKPTLSGLP